MNVKELIEELKKMPQDVNIWHLWAGVARTRIEHVWLARDGYVVTADFGSVCYNENDRPWSAPTEAENKYWETPKTPITWNLISSRLKT